MSRRKLRMRQIREILRYHFDHHVSYGDIATVLKVSKGSIYNTIKRFKDSGMSWPIKEISDSALESFLYPSKSETVETETLPSIEYLEKEMSRRHVTLQGLFEEYQQRCPHGLKRTAFYNYYNKHQVKPVTMKIVHKAGDKLYVDYSGDSISYIDRASGEVISTELFVCCWGASSYCYAEVTASQKQDDFTQSHVRAFEYFERIPNSLVPDNLKSAVTRTSRYDPTINRVYGAMAEHYDVVILPARPAKPKDKAVVESNVLHIQRFILKAVRDRTFFSLAEINKAVRTLLKEFNQRPMKEHGNATRLERFMELDYPAARSLPTARFEISRIAHGLKVAPNYHIRFEDHYYSVPHQYARKKVDIYLKGGVVEIYCDGVHLCRHLKGLKKYAYTTKDEHMPENHKFVKGWSSSWFIMQAGQISSEVAQVIKLLLQSRRHPEQSFNGAMGILRLAKAYGNERLTLACKRATHFKSISFNSIASILKQGLDQQPWGEFIRPKVEPIHHDNIRGNSYYKKESEEMQCTSKQF